MRVVIFGDDREQLDFDAFVLRQAGLQPMATINEEKFLSLCADEAPDLVVMDANSKDTDLLPVVGKVRSQSDVPLMLLSPEKEEEYILKALDLGADDYLVKPHSPRMLAARVKVLLRRGRPIPLSALGPVTIQGLTLDPEQHVVITPQGSTVRLTNMEFRLLFLLMRNPDRVIPSETIIERVWGYEGEGEGALVKNLISRLRHKVEPNPSDPRYIKTVPGVGYSFAPTTDESGGG
ncbi:MAG: response regulator transcription factor [Anaerolineae bacterium]